jgi:signal transduction histidine kinase
MNLISLLPLALFVIGNAILGLAIIINNPKSWTNRLFSSLILVLTIYLVLNSYLNQSTETQLDLVLSRAIISLGAVINLVVFLFLDTFPQSKITLRKRILLPSIAITVFLFFAGFSPLIFANVSRINNAIVPTPGPLIPLFLAHTVGFVFGGIIEIFLRYRKAHGTDRSRIQFILFSFFVLFTLIVVFNFIFPVFLKFGHFIPFLPIYLLVFNAIVTYSIIRHRLLDMRLLVARSIGYIFIVNIIGSIYSLSFFVVERYLFNTSVSIPIILTSVIFVLLITFSFQLIRNTIERLTERIFYRHTYNRQKLLEDLTHVMAATLRLEDITQLVLSKLKDSLQVSDVSVILLEEGKVSFLKRVGDGQEHFRGEELMMAKLAENAFLQPTEKILLLEEVADPQIKDMMLQYGYQVILALMVEDKLLGGLFFGEKQGGTLFSNQDIEVLKILAPEFAIAAKNSLSYEEIRTFNITLKDEIEKATEKLKQTNLRLKELDLIKNEFVSVASHELRTPMTAIKSYLWLALNQPPKPLDPVVKDQITIAYNSTERLIRLVQDMLIISRIEGNRLELKKTENNLAEIVQSVYDELKISADEKHINFTIKNPYGEAYVLADKDKLREVIQNILGNALKFTPEKGKIEIIFERNVIKKVKMITLKVKDTGPGIAKADLPKLFHKFSRLEHSYQQMKGSGTGLGLYIAKQIIDLHDGEISVESELDKGSTFIFSLPELMTHSKAPKEAKK